MTRYLSPALALVLCALPVDAQEGEALPDGKTEAALAPELGGAPTAAHEQAEAVDEAEGFEGDETDFCGGEETVADLAYVILFLPMIVVIAFRPRGLFGRAV